MLTKVIEWLLIAGIYLLIGALAMMLLIIPIGAVFLSIDLDAAAGRQTYEQKLVRARDALVQECLKLETYTREECILMVGQGR